MPDTTTVETVEVDAEDVQCALEDLIEIIQIWGEEETRLAWAILEGTAEQAETIH